MNWSNQITSDSTIMFGKPVINGTRIPCGLIVDKLADGKTVEQLLKSYTYISAIDTYACLHYAA